LQTEGSPVYLGAVKFGELVKEYTDGRYEIAVFPNCALGNGIQATSTEMVQKGTLDMVATSFNLFIASEPSFAVLNLPWLLAGDDFVDTNMVYGAAIYGKLDEMMQNNNIKVLCIYELGWRALSNNVRAVSSPADMQGLKIRVIDSILIDMMNALGASPTNIDFGELYSALQLGACNGQDNPVAGIFVPNRFFEVQNHLTIWESGYTGLPLSMNLDLWNSLSDADKNAFQKAASEAVVYQKDINRSAHSDAIKVCEDNGVEVTHISESQKAAFKAAVEPIYDKYYADADPGFIELFNAALGK
ncbi:MAG: TRAP transporter substrate-binding protein, partial [Oscillospiraceae bacterium]|nr:TRAP transporter substrate-binding protein [Oscillospiraceae bacterium]